MTTLSISKKEILAKYRDGELREKTLLEELFGSEIFSEKVTDRVKTLDDAFKETGRPATPKFSDAPEDMREWFQSLYNAAVFTEALNEGWKADYNDGNQKKWLPWFNSITPSGFAFDDADCASSCPDAGSAARLCLKDESLAIYSGKQITEVHKGIITK
ncbi:MAG: hypothetical protein LBO74_08665 [Candidatus Symbiothrix sp.]|jgi:hypothetical protein|nr:hypothetical protein [Candidatus Symbiothrix sp.]